MNGKIKINAVLRVLTGMHIGGSGVFSPIGAVDSPVVRDTRTGLPIIPGSSLKGKMRTLLASHLNNGSEVKSPNDDCCEIKRLFGASAPEIIKSRLQFADAFVGNADELRTVGLCEVKFENTISRVDCQANPRQIERVISGVEFNVVITYNLPEEDEECEEDMKNLASAMRLLQIDYLGGHGTRGSGRVSFKKIKLEDVLDSVSSDEIKKLEELFKEVEEYELLPM